MRLKSAIDQVRNQVWKQISMPIWKLAIGQVWWQIGSPIRGQIDDQVKDQVQDQIQNNVTSGKAS